MKTDRELIESAAKAAGLLKRDHSWVEAGLNFGSDATPDVWNPLISDGDALRLAVTLGMDVCFGANYVIVRGAVQMPTVNNANDPYAATRHAIVLAASVMTPNVGDERPAR